MPSSLGNCYPPGYQMYDGGSALEVSTAPPNRGTHLLITPEVS